MTFNYKKLSQKSRLFKKINEGYETYENEGLNRKDRKRAIGAGGKFKLQLRERFLILLVYYRLYITYTLTGFLFDVDQSTIILCLRSSLLPSQLSEAQNKYNRILRSKRVVVEHSVCRMKKYEIMGSKFRNKYERYDTMTSIVGGLVNFRIMNSYTSSLQNTKYF